MTGTNALEQETHDLPDGYRMTELGPLPEEWRVVRLGEVADLTMGQSPPSSTYNTHGEGLPFLQGKAEFGDIYPQPIKWCSAPLRVAKRGSVLISVRAPVGDVNLAQRDYCIGRGLAALSGKEPLNNDFLFYFLLNAKSHLEEKGTGSTFKSINKSVLQSFLIPLPPLAEQRAIAHVLRTVQKAKEATERVIAALRELKKSLMRYLFTYGPVPLDAADRVELKDTEIGPIPAHWQVVRLGDLWEQRVLWIKNGFAQGSFNEQGRGVPHLRPFNVSETGEISLAQIKYVPPPSDNNYWLQKGDILFNNTNSEELVGKVAYFDHEGRFTLSNHMTIIRVQEPSVIDRVWLASWLLYLWHRGFTQTLARRHVNQASISLARLRDIPIPLPPLPEQREIARILQAVDEKIQAEEKRKEALEALFKALLHYLMTAKIRLPKEFVTQFEGVNSSG